MSTTIENNEYTFLNHVIFDGVSSTSLFYVTDMSYTLLDKDVQTEQIGKQDGTSIKRVRTAEKDFTLSILFTVDQLVTQSITNIYDLRRTIANYFNSDEPKELIYSADPAIYRKVIYTGTSDIEFLNNRTCKAKVTFLNPTGVEYARDNKVTTNIVPSDGSGNLFLQPEFGLKTKYFEDWTFIEPSEKYNGSRILTANFDEDTEKLYPQGNIAWVKNASRRRIDLSKGDSISASIWVRLNESGSTVSVPFTCAIEEFTDRGSIRTYFKDLPNKTLIVGSWVQFKIENYKVQGTNTNYIALVPRTVWQANLSISRPQLNLGSTLTTYVVTEINLDDKLNLVNDGTYKTYPMLRAKLRSESGLLSFINSNGGVLAFGNAEQLDVAQSVRSDKVMTGGFAGSLPTGSTLNKGVTSYPIYTADGGSTANLMKGSWNWNNKDVATPVYSSSKDDRWNGPAFTVPIPKNSLNKNTGDFTFINRFDFRTGVKERGRIEFVLSSGGKHFLGFVMRDSVQSRNEKIIEYHINDIMGDRSFTLDLKKFDGHFFELQIKRAGNKVTFQLGQITSLTNGVTLKKDAIHSKTYTNDAYKDKAIEDATFWAMRFGNTTEVKMDFTDTKFTWVNTPQWKDVANLFDDQDEIAVDVKNRKLFINGVETNGSEYHNINNEWESFILNPSSNTIIQTITSDWAETPEFEAEFEESFV